MRYKKKSTVFMFVSEASPLFDDPSLTPAGGSGELTLLYSN